MKHKIALVDVDDTLAATQRSILSYLRRHHDMNYRFHDISEDFREGRHREYQTLVNRFLSYAENSYRIPLLPSAKIGLHRLSDAGYQIHIFSSRKEPLHAATERWLSKHDLLSYINEIHPRYSHQSSTEFKLSVAKRTKADIAFDDTHSIALTLANSGLRTFLIKKPWNRNNFEQSNLVKVRNFNHGVSLALE